MPSTPLDLTFTSWVDAPGSPSHPGASDLNRIQDAITFLTNPPSASLTQTNTVLIDSGYSFTVMLWNYADWANTAGMYAPNAAGFTDRIVFPYPGKYRCVLQARTQFNNSAGWAQMQLIYTDSTGDWLEAADGAEPHSVNPRFLMASQDVSVDAVRIARGASVRGQISQSSGGAMSISAGSSTAWPRFTVTWIGTS